MKPVVSFGHPGLGSARFGGPVPLLDVGFGKEASALGDGVGIAEEGGDGVS